MTPSWARLHDLRVLYGLFSKYIYSGLQNTLVVLPIQNGGNRSLFLIRTFGPNLKSIPLRSQDMSIFRNLRTGLKDKDQTDDRPD